MEAILNEARAREREGQGLELKFNNKKKTLGFHIRKVFRVVEKKKQTL